jgi:hypothetical protein
MRYVQGLIDAGYITLKDGRIDRDEAIAAMAALHDNGKGILRTKALSLNSDELEECEENQAKSGSSGQSTME